MFSQIFDAIEEWMRALLTGMIANLDTMFTCQSKRLGEIAAGWVDPQRGGTAAYSV